MQSAAKQQKDRRTLRMEQRAADLEAALPAIRLLLADDHFSAAIGKLREAVNLSRNLPELEEMVVELGIELATDALPRSARLAKCILQEVIEVDSRHLITRQQWSTIKDKEREEAITGALSAAGSAPAIHMQSAARQRLANLLNQYPDEPRLQTRLKSLDAQADQARNTGKLVEAEKTVKIAEDHKLQAQAIWAHAREFQKSGLFQDALDQLHQLREIDPAFPGLEQAIARCQPAPAAVSVNPIPAQPKRDWTRFATAATVLLTVGALAAAGGLIWISQSRRMGSSRHIQPINPDDKAWAAVNPKDPNLVESYLMRFPSGANRARAVQAMAQIRLEHRQSAEVRDTLQHYAAAWNARQARLSPLSSTTLNLSPASAPRIEGDHATITCLRSVSEVGDDGTKKQTPDQLVTFLLTRRDSGWVINKAFTPDQNKSASIKSTPYQPF
jgi:hypothetical protein